MFSLPEYDVSDGLATFEVGLKCVQYPEAFTHPSSFAGPLPPIDTVSSRFRGPPFSVSTVADFLRLEASSPRATLLAAESIMPRETFTDLLHKLSSLILSARPMSCLQLDAGVSATLERSRKRPRDDSSADDDRDQEEDETNQAAPATIASDRLPTGCSTIDQLLGGGFLRGTLTEVSGPAGAGKTQIALQSLLFAAARRIVKASSSSTHQEEIKPSAVYLVAEDLPISRFRAMAASVAQRFRIDNADSLLNAILIKKVDGCDDFLKAVSYVEGLGVTRLKEAVAEGNDDGATAALSTLDLVVVDSIAVALEEDEEKSPQQSSSFLARPSSIKFAAGAALQRLATKANVAVVATNQVRASFSSRQENTNSSSDVFVPALGLAWSSVVNCRLVVRAARESTATVVVDPSSSHTTNSTATAQTVVVSKRQASLVFAPHLSEDTVSYTITARGVEGF